MKITFGINNHAFEVEFHRARQSSPEEPSIYDLSGAETQIRPQWDHDGPRPTALGFQPNMNAGMHNYGSKGGE